MVKQVVALKVALMLFIIYSYISFYEEWNSFILDIYK